MIRTGIAFAIGVWLLAAATAEGAFGPPFDLSPAGEFADFPHVAVDSSGNAHFTWSGSNGTNSVVRTRRRAADGTLGPVQTLSIAGEFAGGPQVAVDSSGNAHFSWIRVNDETLSVVQTRRRAADGTLGPVQTLSTGGEIGDLPQVAVDPSGNAHFVWVRSVGPDDVIAQSRRRAADGTLGAVENLSAAGGRSSNPQVAVDPAGNAHFTWNRHEEDGFIAQTRRRAADGTLGAVEDLARAGQDGPTRVAVDASGNAQFTWTLNPVDDSNPIAQTRRRTAGGTLGAVVNLSPAGAEGVDPNVAFDASGAAHFTWYSRREGADYNAQTRRRAADGTLAAVQDLTAAGEHFDEVRVAVVPSGIAHFVWTRRSGTHTVVQARRADADGTLGAIQHVSSAGASSGGAQIAVDVNGIATLVWGRGTTIQGAVTANVGVAIASGPSGLVAQRNARFEFAALDQSPSPGRFECSLDGGAFAECESPVGLADLADGEHVFKVRFHPAGADPSEVAERRWTVDTTPPAVVIDSAPSGEGNPPDAQIVFHSTEPEGATFTCRLDSGPALDCSSPHALLGLASDSHAFSVVAFDRAGNASAPALFGWSVARAVPPTPVPFACAPGAESVTFGPIRLVARAADACFTQTTVGGQAVHIARGRVTMNGIGLDPAAGTQIAVTPRIGDGRVRTDGPVTVEFGAGITRTYPSLDLDSLVTASNVVNRVLGLGAAPFTIGGLAAEGSAGLAFSADNGGQVTVTFRVKLPEAAFDQLPGSPHDGVTVEFAPTLSNDKGLTVAGKIKVAQLFLFGIKAKDLELGFDSASGVFEGAVGIEFGREQHGVSPTLTGTIGLGLTSAPCGLSKLGLQASNLNRHLSHGIHLQRFGGTFSCVSAAGAVSLNLTAGGGVSLGPRMEVIDDVELEAVSIDGTATLSLPVSGSAPLSFEIAGTGKIVDVPVSEQSLKYTAPARLDLKGKLELAVGGYGAQLSYGEGAFVSPDAFNIEAAGSVNLFGLRFAAQAVYSSVGFAVCFGPPGEQLGFGKRWLGGEGLTTYTVCDVGAFRVPASAAQAGRSNFTVEPGGRVTVIAAKGGGAPPKIVVRGPGERVETPAGPEAVSRKDVLVVQDPERDTTFVVLFAPRPGRWSVSGATSVRVARGLPPLKVSATVRRGVLRWRTRGLAGQRIQFVERSGGLAHPILTTRRGSGRLRFTPDPALGARRSIEAVAYNGATPRKSLTVARFRVAPPPRPTRVRAITLKRGVLRWRAQAPNVRYEVALTQPDGTTRSLTASRARVQPAGLPRTGTLGVSIVAVNAIGRLGPLTRARFKLG